MTLIKSTPVKSEFGDTKAKIEADAKAAETMSRFVKLIEKYVEGNSENAVAIDALCEKLDGFISLFSKEEEKDDSIPTAITSLIEPFKKLIPQKIDFSPINNLAESIEKQNKALSEIATKISQPQTKQDNSGYESLVRESLAAIARNSESMKSIVESIKMTEKKEDKKPIQWVHTPEYTFSGLLIKVTSKPVV